MREVSKYGVISGPCFPVFGLKIHTKSSHIEKQPSRVVLKKRCSKIMQPFYKRTSMLKCDFNKVAKHPFLIAPLDGCFGTMTHEITWS